MGAHTNKKWAAVISLTGSGGEMKKYVDIMDLW